jgi:hypothetical protein
VAWERAIVLEGLELIEQGLSDRSIGERLGVPPLTVRNWRRRPPRAATRLRDGACATCTGFHDLAALDSGLYGYVLGLYLGDGCLGRMRRTWSLRIACDGLYARQVEEGRLAVARLCPSGSAGVSTAEGTRCVTIYAYSNQWPCLFPQHGPGKKHHRRIALEPWQQAHVDAAPFRFLRGLIHSDGWRGVNKVRVKGRDYAYPHYQFSSRSDDIRRLFTDTCDRVGVAWRPWGRWHVSVARRDSVALLDEHIGEKA